MNELSLIYDKLLSQFEFKYQLPFLLLFNKNGEDDEIITEIELPITLSFTQNLTQSEIENDIIQWTLKNRIQSVEMKESGWKFQRTNTMGMSFC